ncbi:hypothetical protein BON23_1830 [Saccharomyces cerevisiae]|nr:hypothetical protein BON23_1830 [Saccharomyces cerevisiae]
MAESHRLYVKGKHLSYQRSKRVNNPNVSLIKIEGVATSQEAQFYLGKRIGYVYRASKEVRGFKIRVMWGNSPESRNSGVVRAYLEQRSPRLSGLCRIFLVPI